MQNTLQKLQNLSNKQIFGLILILVFVVYFNSLFNNFVWDDEEQIVLNPLVHEFANIFQVFEGSTFNSGGASVFSGIYYRPLMIASFIFNYALWKDSSFGFHLFQISIHAINAFLLFLVTKRLFILQKIKFTNIWAIGVGSIFAIHPAISEAVAYISSTQEVLYTSFVLLAFLYLLKYLERIDTKYLYYLSAFVLLALLGKESGIVIIPIILIYTYLFYKQSISKIIYASIIPITIYMFMRIKLANVGFSDFELAPISSVDTLTRLTTLPAILFKYPFVTILPINLSISQHFIIESVADYRFVVAVITAILLLWFFITKLKIQQDKFLIFLVCWTAVSFGPISNIFPLDMTFAERWLYFPIIGLLLITSYLLAKNSNYIFKIFKITSYVFLLILFLLSVRTISRNSNWKDGLTLYAHDLAINENAYDLQNNYGVELFRAGKLEEAKKHFEKSIELQPNWAINRSNLGAIYSRGGDLDNAELKYREALEIGDYYLVVENLTMLLVSSERYEEANEFISEQIQYRPYNFTLNYAYAISLYKTGDNEEALKHAENAFYLSPTEQTNQLVNIIKTNDLLEL